MFFFFLNVWFQIYTDVKELGETGFVKRSIKKVSYEPGGKKITTDVEVEFDPGS